MHFASHKKQVSKVISVDDDDIQAFKALEAKGVVCTAQGVPEDPKVPILTLIGE